ncbi:FRG domain-containing protein [Pseudomonas nitroreducens]|uniref:FRG domain-containing protein n=1 Tax=Pseudomonas nitroreducens TaxID=46680 RepID=UPI0026586B48|nr:FRG domain-containing protein [Pseudomonas nitroreducens]MCP1651813.1 hypothetical protein [Pseudomonas nitroreducens]MCP1689559.1 hypothetical protein [Pseudomonas nitroreducens]
MEVINCDSFERFESHIEDKRKLREKDNELWEKTSPPLYRGHADETWRLETTLERFSPETKFFEDYLNQVENIRHQVSGFTGKEWPSASIQKNPAYSNILAYDDFSLQGIEYLVYLRHHGFPSPLMDWTASPYIAALFAFSGCNEEDGRIAIFSYQAHVGGVKAGVYQAPFIKGIGPIINSHRRHIVQQAQYTICAIKEEGEYKIHSHAELSGGVDQDVITKYTIPKTERTKVLRKLEEFNLNLFSLYGSEDSLMSTLATRTYKLNMK